LNENNGLNLLCDEDDEKPEKKWNKTGIGPVSRQRQNITSYTRV